MVPRWAIVGSGPSGFYSMKFLFKAFDNKCKIDMFEKLPVPFGLVRYGVAPDHQDVKNVQNDFTKIITEDLNQLRFFGNVNVGKQVKLSELKQHYDGIILAYGADEDRDLGLAGEKGDERIKSAREVVSWYNSYPSLTEEESKRKNEKMKNILSDVKSVVIIGNGNVSIDVARVLTSSASHFTSSDISAEALSAIANSKLEQVHIVGRRDHTFASFTIKEFRELTKLANVSIRQHELRNVSEKRKEEVEKDRAKKRLDALIREIAEKQHETSQAGKKQISFRFNLKPSVIAKDANGRLRAVEFEGEEGSQRIDCDLLIKSIGYKSVPIESNVDWWNAQQHVARTMHGGKVEEKIYAVGWVKRGPSGIVGTNITDAKETIACIMKDVKKVEEEKEDVLALLKNKRVDFIDWNGAQKILQFEERQGKEKRSKVNNIERMLALAKGGGDV